MKNSNFDLKIFLKNLSKRIDVYSSKIEQNTTEFNDLKAIKCLIEGVLFKMK